MYIYIYIYIYNDFLNFLCWDWSSSESINLLYA